LIVLYISKDDFYRTNHNLSLNRLVNLGTFKFVKNQFKVADTIGNYLDAYYYLTHCKKIDSCGSIGQNEFGQLYGNRTQCELEQQKRVQRG
jgi:hypothetical protein